MSAEQSARSVSDAEGVDRVRALQRVLYRSAKSDPARRFHALFERLHSEQPADGIEGGGDMDVEVGVDSIGDGACGFYEGHGHPFLSQSSRGGTAVPGRRTVLVDLREQAGLSPSGTGRAASVPGPGRRWSRKDS